MTLLNQDKSSINVKMECNSKSGEFSMFICYTGENQAFGIFCIMAAMQKAVAKELERLVEEGLLSPTESQDEI